MARKCHSGHPLRWFKDQNAARQAFECAICLEILENPVQVRDCGHQFCALCIDDILKYTAILCNFLIRCGKNVNQLDVGKLEKQLQTLMSKVSTLENKLEQDVKQLKLKHEEDVRLLGKKIEALQSIGAAHASQQEPDADYTLKIPNFTRKLAQANSVGNYGVKSEPFFSSHGYKMELMVKLNEAPSGNPEHMGVYLVLVQSDRDATLTWPFTKCYTLVLVDQQDDLSQRQNIKFTMIPRGEEPFQRPWQRENKGAGIIRFVKHSTLHTRQYMRDDTVYIKVFIDP